MSTDQSELTYKSGATLHSECDCCEHAAKRIAELEQALRSILSIYESEQLEDAEAMDEVGKIARNAIKI